MLEYDEPDKLLGMKRMDGGMQHVTKSRTMSAVHAEIGDWKGNPSRWLEVMPITKHARHALQDGGVGGVEGQGGERYVSGNGVCPHARRWGSRQH